MKKQVDLSIRNILDKYDNQLLGIISADLKALKHLSAKSADPSGINTSPLTRKSA